MKNKIFAIIIFWIVSIIPLQACSFFYGKTPSLSYPQMFDSLWNDYNETYALFEVRGVDWKEQYEKCRPLVSEDMTDKEFLNVLKKLLYPLDDAHVYVKAPMGCLNSGEDNVVPDNFSLDEVCSQFIENPKIWQIMNGIF